MCLESFHSSLACVPFAQKNNPMEFRNQQVGNFKPKVRKEGQVADVEQFKAVAYLKRMLGSKRVNREGPTNVNPIQVMKQPKAMMASLF